MGMWEFSPYPNKLAEMNISREIHGNTIYALYSTTDDINKITTIYHKNWFDGCMFNYNYIL